MLSELAMVVNKIRKTQNSKKILSTVILGANQLCVQSKWMARIEKYCKLYL